MEENKITEIILAAKNLKNKYDTCVQVSSSYGLSVTVSNRGEYTEKLLDVTVSADANGYVLSALIGALKEL